MTRKNTIPISVCVTTKNNEDTIEKCLSSVYQWVDEIVVVDSDSTDSTLQICDNFDADIYQREFHGFGDIKTSAIEEANNEWVLILDADEWVSEDLKREIIAKYEGAEFEKNDAFFIKKKNKMFGRWMHVEHPKRPLLARSDSIHYEKDLIHEKLSLINENDNSKRLENKIMHIAYERVSEKIKKVNQYASLQALQYVKGDEPSKIRFLVQSIGAFFFYYIFSKGFLDGYQGFIYSILETFQVALCYQKLDELKKLKRESNDWEEKWLSLECRR